MPSASDPQAFRKRMERLETLIEEVEGFPDAAAREHTREVVQAVLFLHAIGLERILEHLGEAGEPGPVIADGLARDDVVSGLLLLYGLHPLGVEERVRLALDRVRPTLRKHGGEVELVNLVGNLARLRVRLNGHGCGSTAAMLRRVVEDAVYERAPELTALEVESLPEAATSPTSTFVSVDELTVSLSAKATKENSHGKTNSGQSAPAGACAGHQQE